MEIELEKITKSFSSLKININKFDEYEYDELKIIKIQKCFRGYIFRLKRLPLILYIIQKYLKSTMFNFSNQTEDGRINSCLDEDEIIKLLIERFNNKIKKPKIRMWYRKVPKRRTASFRHFR